MKTMKLSEGKVKVRESEFLISIKEDCFERSCIHFPDITHDVLKKSL